MTVKLEMSEKAFKVTMMKFKMSERVFKVIDKNAKVFGGKGDQHVWTDGKFQEKEINYKKENQMDILNKI